ELAEFLRRERVNSAYLPGHRLAEQIEISAKLGEALEGAHIVVGAVPAAFARKVYTGARPFWQKDTIMVSATKGLGPGTHARMSQVILDVLGEEAALRTAVLSGPSFAAEVARGEPTAVVVAGRAVLELARVSGRHYADSAAETQAEFVGPGFRLY